MHDIKSLQVLQQKNLTGYKYSNISPILMQSTKFFFFQNGTFISVYPMDLQINDDHIGLGGALGAAPCEGKRYKSVCRLYEQVPSTAMTLSKCTHQKRKCDIY